MSEQKQTPAAKPAPNKGAGGDNGVKKKVIVVGAKAAPKAKPKKAPAKKAPAKKAQPKAQAPVKGAAISTEGLELLRLKISDIVVDKGANARVKYEAAPLKALALNIQRNGLINPLQVYRDSAGKYHLVAGERRLRACKLNKNFKVVPVFVIPEHLVPSVRDAENSNRVDLAPMEDARQLQSRLGTKEVHYNAKGDAVEEIVTVKYLAADRGVTDGHISQRLALLDLPAPIQTAVEKEKITFSTARELCTLKNPEAQMKVFKKLMSGKGDVTVGKVRQAREQAQAKDAVKGKKGRGRPVTTVSEDAPNISRQSLDTALERLQSLKFALRKKEEVREAWATLFERHAKARSDDKRLVVKGQLAAIEWLTGVRENL